MQCISNRCFFCKPTVDSLNNQEAFPDQESVIELTLFDVDVRHDSGGTGT